MSDLSFDPCSSPNDVSHTNYNSRNYANDINSAVIYECVDARRGDFFSLEDDFSLLSSQRFSGENLPSDDRFQVGPEYANPTVRRASTASEDAGTEGASGYTIPEGGARAKEGDPGYTIPNAGATVTTEEVTCHIFPKSLILVFYVREHLW